MRDMSVAQAIFWGWMITLVLSLSAFSTLYVYTLSVLDKELPGWVSLQVLSNRIMALNNERAHLQNTYLIGNEREIRNLRMVMTRKDLEEADQQLERRVMRAIGGK